MRFVKRVVTAAAAVLVMSCGAICFAENENYVVTTTTGTSAQGQNGVVWTQISQSTPDNGLENDAVAIGISVSNIQDGKFTAAVEVKTEDKIAYFAGTVGYNSDEYKLVSAQLAQGDSGVLQDEMEQGTYSFKYSNEQGSDRSGEYIILRFEMIKDSKKDDVLFLTVKSLLDVQTNSLSFNKTDGIIAPSSSPDVSQDVKSIRLAAYARPYTFEELGFADIINCELDDNQVAKYSEGGIVAMTPGNVSAKLINKDYAIQKVNIEVYRVDANGEDIITETKVDDKKTLPTKGGLSVNIGVPILLCAALVFARIVIINRPKYKRPSSSKISPVRGSYDPRYQSRPINRRPRR